MSKYTKTLYQLQQANEMRTNNLKSGHFSFKTRKIPTKTFPYQYPCDYFAFLDLVS